MWLFIVLTLIIFLATLKMVVVLTKGKCTCTKDMTGKIIIITGANRGIGKETARALANLNATVILACRNLEYGQAAANDIRATSGNQNVFVKHLDLSSLQSVRRFAEDVMKTECRLDILINNAGMVPTSEFQITEDGLELQFAANYFGHFLLTNLLLPLLKNSAPSRIVMVSSVFYLFGSLNLENLNCELYQDNRILRYCNSKLANILFAVEMSHRLRGSGVTINSLHPGSVKTEIAANIPWYNKTIVPLISPFLKTCEEGAQTSLFLAVSENVENISGLYFADCKPYWLHPKARNEKMAVGLWEKSEIMTGLKKHNCKNNGVFNGQN